MKNLPDEKYWSEEFDITQDDLNRIVNRIKNEQRAFTLTEMSKRVIRGRLLYGKDQSPTFRVGGKEVADVKLWHPAAQWLVGDRAILLTAYMDPPLVLGEVREVDKGCVKFKVDGFDLRLIELQTAPPGSSNAKVWSKKVEEKYAEYRDSLDEGDIDKNIEKIFLNHGTIIVQQLTLALQGDLRFIALEDKWFITDCIHKIDKETLVGLFREMLKIGKSLSISEMLSLLKSKIPQNDIGLFSLYYSVQQHGEALFENTGASTWPKWIAITPPPPIWQEAIGAYFVYDPINYEIILKPGDQLTEVVANRLNELDLYADVVQPKDQS